MDKIKICCGTDENYVDNTAVMIYSLLKNNSWVNEINIIENSLSIESKRKLKSVGKIFDAKVNFLEIEKKLFEGFPTPSHFTLTIYHRLLLPKKLEGRARYLLWLDSDLIIDEDISGILKYLPKNKTLSVAPSKKAIDKGIFNTGVMIINIKQYNKRKTFEKILNSILTNNWTVDPSMSEVIKENERLYFPIEYNYIYKSIINYPKIKPKIIHYNTKIKPWLPGCNHPHKEKYFEYLRETPNVLEKQIKKSIYEMIKEKIPYSVWFRLTNVDKILKRKKK